MTISNNTDKQAPATDAYLERLKEILFLQEELTAQTELFSEQSVESFAQATSSAQSYSNNISEVSQHLDSTAPGNFNRSLEEVSVTAERTFQGFNSTFGRLLAEEMWNTDGIVRWDRALVGLAKHLTAGLISSLITTYVQLTLTNVATKAGAATNIAYAASIYKIAMAYAALAAARSANKAIPGIGMVVHQGGYIMHSGGPVRMHGGGLKADERPAILQTGEYVLRRDAVRKIGLSNLDRMNTGGYPPGGQSQNFTIHIQAWDGADVERVFRDRIVPLIERESRDGRLNVMVNS